MKNVPKPDRAKVLSEAIQKGQDDVRGKHALLFDDLIESGATLGRTTEVLLKDGGATAVYALVLTRTK
jgi:phosphoribosylpyrophosphate synthetase